MVFIKERAYSSGAVYLKEALNISQGHDVFQQKILKANTSTNLFKCEQKIVLSVS